MKTYWHRRANISIGTVTTLEPGSDATASVTEDNVLSLGIPQGAQGEPGIQGPPMTYDDMSAADKAALAGEVADDLPFASTGGHGVVQIGSGLTVDSDGVLSATGVESPEMTGATASTAGTGGTVPAPAAGKQNSFLRGDATWSTLPEATTSAAGLMSAADKTKLDGIESNATKKVINETTILGEVGSLPTTFSSTAEYTIPNIQNYDFLIFEYITGGSSDFSRNTLVYSLSRVKSRIPTATASFVVDSFMLAATPGTTSKIASRSGGVRIVCSDGAYSHTAVYFNAAYYSGTKNNNFILPTKVIMVKL